MKMARWTCIFAFLWLGLWQPIYPQDPKPPSEPVQPLLIFERSGGYAGVQEQFEIHLDGSIMNAAGVKRRISNSRFQSLRQNITALNFQAPSEKIDSHMGSLCLACFHYRITIMSPEGRVVISMNEVEMARDNEISALARSIRDLVSGLKWR